MIELFALIGAVVVTLVLFPAFLVTTFLMLIGGRDAVAQILGGAHSHE